MNGKIHGLILFGTVILLLLFGFILLLNPIHLTINEPGREYIFCDRNYCKPVMGKDGYSYIYTSDGAFKLWKEFEDPMEVYQNRMISGPDTYQENDCYQFDFNHMTVKKVSQGFCDQSD